MGHDRVPNSILRLGSEELAPSLTTIYNNCIDACYWPSEWKKGEWTPVYKKDSIYEVKNYRPVTLHAPRLWQSVWEDTKSASYSIYRAKIK